MAIRKVRVIGDEILTKTCKPVKEMTPRIAELIDDMFETMYEENGVGLAASQVGVLRQIVTIDVDDGNQYVLINPEILELSLIHIYKPVRDGFRRGRTAPGLCLRSQMIRQTDLL